LYPESSSDSFPHVLGAFFTCLVSLCSASSTIPVWRVSGSPLIPEGASFRFESSQLDVFFAPLANSTEIGSSFVPSGLFPFVFHPR